MAEMRIFMGPEAGLFRMVHRAKQDQSGGIKTRLALLPEKPGNEGDYLREDFRDQNPFKRSRHLKC